MNEYLLFAILCIVGVSVVGLLLYLRFKTGILTRIGLPLLIISSFTSTAAFISGKHGISAAVVVPLGAIAVLLFVGIAYFLYRAVVKPIKDLRKTIEKLTVDKDLRTVPETVNRTDEFGQMQNALVELIVSLRNFTTSVTDTAKQVHGASEEMATTSIQLLTSLSQETTSVQEVVTATRQMDVTSDNIVHQSQKVAQDTSRIDSASKESLSRLEALHKGIAHFNDLVDDVGTRMTLLEQSVSQIQSIIDSVSVFADQSSVLAVNASIEAANAGERGLGFAVVASEVSSLARHSSNSADQVRAILSTIEKSVGELGRSVAQSMGQLSRSQNDVEELSIFMKELNKVVGQSTDQSHSAVKMITEQRTGYKQINTAMEQISISSTESARQTERMREAMSNLTAMSETLSKELSQFKL